MHTKKCTKCGDTKPINQFYLVGKYPKGECKECSNRTNNIRRQQKRTTDINYFLTRVYDNMKKRCDNQSVYKDKLHISRQDFYTWARETLPKFMELHGFTTYAGNDMSIDKIDDSLGYRQGNLQWLLKKDNTTKGNISKRVKVLQYSLEGTLLNQYSSVREATLALGKDPSKDTGITKCINGKRKTSHGFIWKKETH